MGFFKKKIRSRKKSLCNRYKKKKNQRLPEKFHNFLQNKSAEVLRTEPEHGAPLETPRWSDGLCVCSVCGWLVVVVSRSLLQVPRGTD